MCKPYTMERSTADYVYRVKLEPKELDCVELTEVYISDNGTVTHRRLFTNDELKWFKKFLDERE